MEAVKVISMLVALGAVGWMGMVVLIGGNPVTMQEYDYDVSGGLKGAGTVFVIAVAINILAGRLDKNRK